MKLKNVFALGVLGLLTLGVGATAYAIDNDDGLKSAQAAEGDIVFNITNVDTLPMLKSTGNASQTYTSTDGTQTLDVNFVGLRTASNPKTGSPSRYGYLMLDSNVGFAYANSALDGYYVSSVAATYTNSLSTSGRTSCTFTPNALTTIQDANDPVIKNGTKTYTNTDNTQFYWNFSTSNKNVQVETLKVTYSVGKTIDPSVRDYTLKASNSYIVDDIKDASVTLTPAFSSNVEVNWSVLPGGEDVIAVEKDTQDQTKASVLALGRGTATINVNVKDGTDYDVSQQLEVTVIGKIDVLKTANVGTAVNDKFIVSGYDFNKSIYVGDEQGYGIQVYDNSGNKFNGLKFGDEVTIVGEVGEHNGKNQIVPTKVTKTGKTKTITPQLIASANAISATDIGDYVKLIGVTYVSTTPDGNSTDILLKDAKGVQFKCHTNNNNEFLAAFKTFVETNGTTEPFDLTFIADFYSSKPQFKVTDSLIYEGKTLSQDGMIVVNMLNDELTCDSTGATAPSKAKWNEIAEYASLLNADDLAYLKDADYADGKIGLAVQKYDYIVAKYGATEYANFLNRTVTTIPASNMTIMTNSDVIITVTVVSILAVTSIVLLAMFKRKKERNI